VNPQAVYSEGMVSNVIFDEGGISLAFEASEYEARLGLLRRRMETAKLDAVICISPPTLFCFCGYDGQSYCNEQALVVTLDEHPPVLIVRDIDRSLANGIAGNSWGDRRPHHYPDENPAQFAGSILTERLDHATKKRDRSAIMLQNACRMASMTVDRMLGGLQFMDGHRDERAPLPRINAGRLRAA
jgi:Xaa-Pro aminopeptidase